MTKIEFKEENFKSFGIVTMMYKDNEQRGYIYYADGLSKPFWAEYLGGGYLPDKVGRYKTFNGAKRAIIKYVENFDKTHIRLNSNNNLMKLFGY